MSELDFEMHFVVRYDPEAGKFLVDAETTDAKFYEGQVWTGDEWYKPREGDDPQMHSRLYEVEESLARLLDTAQKD
jgi:hypothetical protein